MGNSCSSSPNLMAFPPPQDGKKPVLFDFSSRPPASSSSPMAGEPSSSDRPPRFFFPPSPSPSLTFPPPQDGKKPVFFDFSSRPSTSSPDSSTAESSTHPHYPKKRKTAEEIKKRGRDKKSKKETGARPSASSCGSNDFVDCPHPSLMMINSAPAADEVPVPPPVPRKRFSYCGSGDDAMSLVICKEDGQRGQVDIRVRASGKWTVVIRYISKLNTEFDTGASMWTYNKILNCGHPEASMCSTIRYRRLALIHRHCSKHGSLSGA